MALNATARFKKSNWLECHRYHYLLLKNQFTNTLLLGDSIIAGLSRYLKEWQRYFTPLNALNLEIGGDRAENVLRQANNNNNNYVFYSRIKRYNFKIKRKTYLQFTYIK